MKTAQNKVKFAQRNLWSGILFGLGFVAFLDETLIPPTAPLA